MTTSVFGSDGPFLECIRRATLKAIGLLSLVVLSLTMAARAQAVAPPTVTARPANLVSDTNATLIGIVNPNGADTAYQFVWGPSSLYGHTNSYGQLPAQDATLGVTNKLTDLTPNTLYHYYLVATNSAGTGISPDMTFTTTGPGPNPGAPTVTINSVVISNDTGAFLIGTVNPNGAETACHFLYGTTTAYGHTTSYSPLPAQNADLGVTNLVLGLSPGTLYHCQLVATNSAGSSASGDMTFTTGPGPNPQPPTVTVDGASQITDTNALITGTINPNGLPSAFYVRWGTNTPYDRLSRVYPVPSLPSAVVVSNWMTDLSPNTLYHYQLVATNLAGNSYSADMTLTTLPPSPPPTPQAPSATTGPATSITSTSATLNGTVNPNHADTSCYFVWGTAVSYGNTNSYGSVPAQSGPTGTATVLTGLTPNTTYHYQVLACNSVGSASGGDQTFTTLDISASGGFTYITTNGEITITGYDGPGGDVVIPGTIDGLPVTAIANSAFAQQMTLTGVTIPDSVTDLGGGAFEGCTSLVTVNLGRGITTIKGGAEAPGWGTFMACTRLTSITIPDNVTNITDGVGSKGGPFGAFSSCTSLTNVTIGKGLTYLGNGTFTYCVNLRSVCFPGDAPAFGSSSTPILTTPFFNATNVIVYYVPGTAGWGPTYADRPTAPWLPRPLAQGPSFGMRDNRFGFNITGPPGVSVLIEACADVLAGEWIPLRSCSLTNGLIYFSDPDGTNSLARFYRVRSP